MNACIQISSIFNMVGRGEKIGVLRVSRAVAEHTSAHYHRQKPGTSCGALIHPAGPWFVHRDPTSSCGALLRPAGPSSVSRGPDPP